MLIYLAEDVVISIVYVSYSTCKSKMKGDTQLVIFVNIYNIVIFSIQHDNINETKSTPKNITRTET